MHDNPKIVHELAWILQDLIIRIGLMPKTKKFIIGNPLIENLVETINHCHEGLHGLTQSKILASARFNTFKLLLKNAYELKLIQEGTYLGYIERTADIGRMLGGWIRKI